MLLTNDSRKQTARRRRAVVLVQIAVIIPVLLGVAALTVDVGYMFNVRAQLQLTADAAALAGTLQLPDELAAPATALENAGINFPNHGTVLAPSDIHLGQWDADLAVFTAGRRPMNAVRVVVRRSQQNGNPAGLFFARVFGIYHTDITAAATAYGPTLPPNFGVRFLIDDEMFDTDVPAIEDFADELGVSSEVLLTDADGDDFIDFPPTVIELPTGQVGDEALFEIGPDFRFTRTSSPSLADFLLFEEGGNQHGILKSQLDPLIGVEPVYDPGQYPDFVDLDHVHVSPVYKSDVANTEPGVNALGERRGLVAFKIIAVGSDPDGAGPVLPNLVVEIVDPSSIPNGLGSGSLMINGMVQIVQ